MVGAAVWEKTRALKVLEKITLDIQLEEPWVVNQT